MQNPSTIRRFALLLIGAALAPVSLVAQDSAAEDRVHEMLPFTVTSEQDNGYRATTTISASRINVPLDEVPANIAVMTSDLIQDTGSTMQREALDWHAAINGKSIRGFDTGEFYRNGFQHLSDTQGFFIQRMEIVRGPTAILNGPIQPGGGVNIITKQATLGDNFGEARVEQGLGEASEYRNYYVDLNAGSIGPEAEYGDTVAFRFLAGYQYDSGRAKGVGKDYGAYMPSLRIRPFENTRITAEYYGYKLDSDRTDNHAAFRKTLATDPQTRAQIPLAEFPGIQPWDTWLGPDAEAPEELSELSLNLNQIISPALFFDISYNRHDRDLKFLNMMHGNGLGGINAVLKEGAPANSQNINDYWIERRFRDALIGNVTDQYSGLLTWIVDQSGEGNHRVIFGYQTFDQERLLFFADGKNLDGSGVYRDLISPFATDLSVPVGSFYYDYENPALNQREFNEQTTAYINWLGEWLDGRLHTMISAFNTDMSQVFAKKDGSNRQVRHEGDEILPQLGFVYEVSESLGIYGARTESAAINSNQAPPTNQLDLFFPPLSGEMTELGIRFDLMEGKLIGSLGIYQVNQNNRLEYDPIEDVFVNVGDIESRGVDLDIFYYPTDNASIVFSYAQNNKELPSGAEQFANPDKLTIWGKYTFDHGPMAGVSLGGGYIWRDGTPLSNGNFTSTSPAYDRLDLLISKEGSLTQEIDYYVSLNVRNLTGDAAMSTSVVVPNMLVGGFMPNSADRYHYQIDPEYQLSAGIRF